MRRRIASFILAFDHHSAWTVTIRPATHDLIGLVEQQIARHGQILPYIQKPAPARSTPAAFGNACCTPEVVTHAIVITKYPPRALAVPFQGPTSVQFNGFISVTATPPEYSPIFDNLAQQRNPCYNGWHKIKVMLPVDNPTHRQYRRVRWSCRSIFFISARSD